mmetsp:Transcript_11124/g.26757  ORF Transcript_11124/g.26757 Transcript_11124/m.26757 type:complete len:238 (+) Transcript_11124:13-726(+)
MRFRPEGNGAGFARHGLPLVLDRTVSANVQLQILLSFGSWFDVIFALLQVLAGWAKCRWIQGTVVTAMFCTNYVLCFVLEPCRLYLGYVGNLGEKVPELFLFVFMCMGCASILFTELFLCVYLEALQPGVCSLGPELPCILPMEQACWIVRLVLLGCELILGVRTLRRLIHEQSARFFVALDSPEGRSFDDLGRATSSGRDFGSGRMDQNGGSAAQTGIAAQVYGRPSGGTRRQHVD